MEYAVRFTLELLNRARCASQDRRGANTVCKIKESAHDLLSVPALLYSPRLYGDMLT